MERKGGDNDLYVFDRAIKVEVRNEKVIVKVIKEILVREYVLDIIVQGLRIRTYLISPKMINEFVYGNLYTLGVIDNVDDVIKVEYKDHSANVYLKPKPRVVKAFLNIIGPSCEEKSSISYTTNKITSRTIIPAKHIISILNIFNDKSTVFRITGGVHAAALFDVKSLNPLVFIEDIGRHNAIDKVIGWGILRKLNFEETVLVTSGRIFTDSIHKAIRAGIPIVVSKSAPTYEAVNYARRANITLIGFARGLRFNVYSGFHRVKELSNYNDLENLF